MNFNAAEFQQKQLNEQLGLPALVVLATLWRRFFGQVIDQFVVLIPVALVVVALGVRSADDLADKAVAVNATVIAIAFTYYVVMIAMWGRTLGKFAMSTRVVRVDTAGPVLWSSAAIRALVPLAAGVIPVVGTFITLMIYASAFFDKRRQGWHDKAAGTIVVTNESAPRFA